MSPCIEKARAIMQVMTVDMWKQKARHERMRLWRMYCSAQIKAHTPDGCESAGYEEVCPSRLATLAAELTCTKCDLEYAKLQAYHQGDWKFALTGNLHLIGSVLLQTWIFGNDNRGCQGWNVLTLNDRGEVESFHSVIDLAQSNSIRHEDEPYNTPPGLALDRFAFPDTKRNCRAIGCSQQLSRYLITPI